MMKTKSTPRSGFTLIELLTVIAIIGILAAILIPTVGAVKKKASMVTSSSNLRQVALAYSTFASGSSRTRVISANTASAYSAADSSDWAEVLAKYADLNDAPLYFISSADDVAAITIPSVILDGSDAAVADWTSASAFISYEMAVDISTNAQSSVTPLIWTKGLGTTGEWATTSPWAGDGGHIAFADGHVTFYDSLLDPADGTTGLLIQGPKASSPGSAAKTVEAALGGAQYVVEPK
ncbi:prepilin-type N-terminal cleavage/methylation domain-containing protein [Coraliomargarita algicola]|uniref:Prepilin-type N-terminal cleavage/methylation domain-containing protein n=1 Tax=Coraliomargarita algicola TaxID=3092156 RepID=A0ABZ0RK02_9BACT|nr:prepilin-type N-terminal cleavage/methylation domain-containing protein [Coraliomargarita sp. J2-16]WPJ95320.1 prepilin-type N-terminal cleavage/methylation domain-containing protein [Coraliomargarita sp. J2-16]